MTALTLIDDNSQNPSPWATLMELGIKTDESRTWPIPSTYVPKLPFDLLLCASASSRTLNRGMAVCVVTLTGSEPFLTEHERAACCEVYPGYVWHTNNLRWLSRKFPVTGKLGLFEVELPPDVSLHIPTPEEIRRAVLAFKRLYPKLDLHEVYPP